MNQTYAGFWRRAVAYLIDWVLLAALVQVSQWALFTVAGGPIPSARSGFEIEAWVLLTISLPVWLYFSLSESIAGQTIGKRLMGLKVARVDGGRIVFGQALARTLLKLLPWELTHVTIFLPTPIFAEPDFRWGFIVVYALLGAYVVVMFFSRRKQSLPDLITQTVVLHARPTIQSPISNL